MKISLLTCSLAVGLLSTGCVSWGGSHEQHWHNDLAHADGGVQGTAQAGRNGQVVCNDGGSTSPVVNGGEDVEKHLSWDINPFTGMIHLAAGFVGGASSRGGGEIVVVNRVPQMQMAYPRSQMLLENPDVSMNVANDSGPYWDEDDNVWVYLGNDGLLSWSGNAWVVADVGVFNRWYLYQRNHPDWHSRGLQYRQFDGNGFNRGPGNVGGPQGFQGGRGGFVPLAPGQRGNVGPMRGGNPGNGQGGRGGRGGRGNWP